MSITFGIDLGTTCSAIGFVDSGVPRLIPVDGLETMPSVVHITEDGQVLVGQPALNRMALDPERTIRSAKRQMGTAHRWTIGDREWSAQEVSAAILRRLCDAAAEATGIRPDGVVITVPAWFTQAQRADTREAGQLAGLDVRRIINEPTAAALAHAHGQDLHRRALVYDLGGGTFDVSLVDQDGPIVEVRASHGDTQLGGDDIDAGLSAVVLERLAALEPALHRAVLASAAAQVRLRLAVEQAKIELSSTTRTRLRVPFMVELDGKKRHLEMDLTREDVEEVAWPLVERTLHGVRRVLEDARVAAKDIHELLLVGGSSRIPMVWEALFRELRLEGSAAIPPDRAVALGAAIQAAIVDGSRVDGVLVDVAPYSLSVGVAVGPLPGFSTHFVCHVITPRNSQLPSLHTHRVSTHTPVQKTVKLPIFQGSSSNPMKNAVLGILTMDGLPRAPAGQQSRPLSVEFRHDLDGMVQVTFTDDISGRSVKGKVVADGDEEESLRQQILDLIGDLEPGDGSEVEDDETAGGVIATPAAEPAPAGPEGVEATFAAVLAARERIEREHPGHADRIGDLTRRGADALARDEVEAAIEIYVQLSDLLFEAGVYL